jgi:Fic family protein
MSNSNRLGRYVLQKMEGESFKTYVPPHLPPIPAINLENLYPLLDKANHALAELNGVASSVPNVELFVYMYVRKEALLSSQIEGTQSSFSDLLLFENELKPNVEIADVEEVSNYVLAVNYGLEQIKNGFPLSLRLLREIHAKLLQGSRGSNKNPGEFRITQNWIGGTRPGNALFVPPSPADLIDCLSDLEKFIHDKKVKLPLLVKVGLLHVQFETIHPFLDGNGRLGRLLIMLLLCENGVLTEPILYMSLYLKKNRSLYYDLLQEVRTDGSWEAWLEFFLEGIYKSAQQALQMIEQLNKLFEDDLQKINTLGRAKESALLAFGRFKKMPQASVSVLARELNLSMPTARVALQNLVKLGLVKEVSGKMRDKIYIYKKYLDLLQAGTEPL